MNQAYTPPLDEILFLLDNVIHWSNLLDLPPYTELDRETFTAILSEAAKFATRELSPINEIGDDEGCQLLDGRVRPPSAFLRAFRKYVNFVKINRFFPLVSKQNRQSLKVMMPC